MKEHAGGTPIYAFEEWNEESFAVPIQHVNYSKYDNLTGMIQDGIAQGIPIEKIIGPFVARIVAEERSEAIRWVLAEVIDGNADQKAWALAFACGMALKHGLGLPDIAKKLGVKKQAFCQCVQALSKRLGLELPVWARDEMARHSMAESYAKRAKSPIKAICGGKK